MRERIKEDRRASAGARRRWGGVLGGVVDGLRGVPGYRIARLDGSVQFASWLFDPVPLLRMVRMMGIQELQDARLQHRCQVVVLQARGRAAEQFAELGQREWLRGAELPDDLAQCLRLGSPARTYWLRHGA